MRTFFKNRKRHGAALLVILLTGCSFFGIGDLSKDWPSRDLILASLADFSFKTSKKSSIQEAKDMLTHMGATSYSHLTNSYVSSVFGSGAEITIWPNSSGNWSYGFRYGKPDSTNSYFSSNDTYFEIVP